METLSIFQEPLNWKLDWSGKGINDIIAFLKQWMAADRWYELNSGFPNDVFYLPPLALNKLVGMEFASLQETFGGGGTHGWGRHSLEDEGFFRATGGANFKRSKKNGEHPVWIFYNPLKVPPTKGPGKLIKTKKQVSCSVAINVIPLCHHRCNRLTA